MNEFINGGVSFAIGMLLMKVMASYGYRGWAMVVSLVAMGLVWFILEFKDFCLKGWHPLGSMVEYRKGADKYVLLWE